MGEKQLRQALERHAAIHTPARNLASRTRKEYLADLEDLVSFLEEKAGITKVGKLSLSNLEAYLAELDNRGLSGATRKRKTVAIRSFLDFLYRQDCIASDFRVVMSSLHSKAGVRQVKQAHCSALSFLLSHKSFMVVLGERRCRRGETQGQLDIDKIRFVLPIRFEACPLINSGIISIRVNESLLVSNGDALRTGGCKSLLSGCWFQID